MDIPAVKIITEPTKKISGSGAFFGVMLLVRIAENIEIDAYFRAGQVK